VPFVWFWTFWHWSTEGFRSGALLRSPLQGIASHWDEWYRHESSETERNDIDAVGASVFEQRRYVCWLARQWAKEARWRGEMLPARYVLAQLSHVAPFSRWAALDRYRATYASPGIAAIVLDEDSDGESADVRRLEAIALPPDEDAAAATIVSDGFHTDAGELNTARRAAMSLLNGKGLIVFLALWLVAGARPYPRYLRILLFAGWLAVVGLIVRLLVGPDPGTRLAMFAAALFALWSALVITAVSVAGALTFLAWRAGRALRIRGERRQLRLRMSDGLSVQGGSAGLAFSLNALLAAHRSHPLIGNRSWLWETFFRRLRSASQTWAATGIVEVDGRIDHVILEPKIRACLRNPAITDILTPWQPEAKRGAIQQGATTTQRVGRTVQNPGMALGFASAKRKLRSHRCAHIAQSVMAIGGFTSKSQIAANVFGLAVTVVMALALPDIHNVLRPPPAPSVVGPGSPSPYYLWVTLDTDRPDAFKAELESGFWSNRRSDILAYGGADGSVRAEMRLTRNARPTTVDELDGTVWINRRRKFLGRDFMPGERVASYPFTHLTALPHD
jgi:hypothetical protein